ncbi:MAG: hypothetical protein ACKOWL_05445 [Sphingobacteriaceae bacterium]
MKKDILQPVVEGISVAVVLEHEDTQSRTWKVYLINQRNEAIDTVLIASTGYGTLNGKEVKTSTLRHSMGTVAAQSAVAIELIDEAVFGLANEYWLSYYLHNNLYDKKFVFMPESIVDGNLIRIPLVNKPGVLIGQ